MNQASASNPGFCVSNRSKNASVGFERPGSHGPMSWSGVVTGPTTLLLKSNKYDKLTQKNVLTSKGILYNLHVSKIFGSVPNRYVKLDKKHDVDVAEPVRSTVLELCPNFLQKWAPESPKMVSPQFWWHIWIWRPRKPSQPAFPPNRINSINLPRKMRLK